MPQEIIFKENISKDINFNKGEITSYSTMTKKKTTSIALPKKNKNLNIIITKENITYKQRGILEFYK